MEQRGRVLAWTAIGLLVGVLLQTSQARYAGNWTGLLAAGSESPLLPVLSSELPTLVVTDGEGHDGQATYGVALDPFLRRRPSLVPDASYRYRRILLPVIGSAFGTLKGGGLLIGLTSVTLAGLALASGGSALIMSRFRLTWWLPLAAVANIGLWLSLQTTTPDSLALGLAVGAIAVATRGRHAIAAALAAAAVLTKETYLLIVLGLAAWAWFSQRDRRATSWYIVAALPAAAWFAYLAVTLGGGFATGGNLSLPFFGLLKASSVWISAALRDQVFTALTLVMLLGSLVVITGDVRALWRYLIAPWLVLAVFSSHWIWDLGNNSLRALAPLLTFAFFAFADRKSSASRQQFA